MTLNKWVPDNIFNLGNMSSKMQPNLDLEVLSNPQCLDLEDMSSHQYLTLCNYMSALNDILSLSWRYELSTLLCP